VHFQVRRLHVAADAIDIEERVCGAIGGRRVAQAPQLIRVFGEADGQRLVVVQTVVPGCRSRMPELVDLHGRGPPRQYTGAGVFGVHGEVHGNVDAFCLQHLSGRRIRDAPETFIETSKVLAKRRFMASSTFGPKDIPTMRN
jgi:hypothetical protein